MAASIRADLLLGTACGLGLSGLIWTVALAPPTWSVPTLLAFVLATAIGAAAVRAPRLGLNSAVYPVSLATLLVLGAGASCVAALLCVGAERYARLSSNRPPRVACTPFRASRAVLSCALAAAAFSLAGGIVGIVEAGTEALLPLAAHALAFGSTRQIATHAWLRSRGRGVRPWRSLRSGLGHLPGIVAGAAIAHGASWAFVRPEARAFLLAVVICGLGLAIARTRVRRLRLVLRQRERIDELHRTVTRALAKTVESGDEATRNHLRRVRRLCIDLGEQFHMTEPEIESLASAALFHDIGKVAVSDRILTKPGRLTHAEMDEVKRHPGVGAEILQSFPSTRPLAPVVRAHHERWDGRGYPDGLEGTNIPLEARILTAVDCYDALTSDRSYRRALPHAEAIAFLHRESGRMFDPEVVRLLVEHLGDREEAQVPESASAFGVACEDEMVEDTAPGSGVVPLAQQEMQTLYDISRAMSYGVTLDEYLTLVACRLSSLVPYRSLVVYILEPEQRMLRAAFAMGVAADKLRLMTIPLGERISGWAAAQRRAVIGQDHLTPMDRDGSRSDLEEWGSDPQVGLLKSTMVAPMTTEQGVVGVVTLYDEIDRSYTPEERRILVRVAGYIAQVAEHRDVRMDTRQTSLTDPLTGVPNARFLWLESGHRVAQCSANGCGFGLLGFRIHGLEQVAESMGNETADRALGQIARRFAACCRSSETLVRFGQELFLVLTQSDSSGDLVERWHDLARDVKSPALEIGNGVRHEVQVTAAHASYPEDGDGLESLLLALDNRLSLAASRGRTVLPFRPRHVTSG